MDAVPVQVQTIRDRLETLVKLEALEDQLNQQATTFPTDVDGFTVRIRKARLYIAQQEDAKAKELLEKISTDLDNVGEARAGGDSKIEAYKRSLEEAATATDRIESTYWGTEDYSQSIGEISTAFGQSFWCVRSGSRRSNFLGGASATISNFACWLVGCRHRISLRREWHNLWC